MILFFIALITDKLGSLYVLGVCDMALCQASSSPLSTAFYVSFIRYIRYLKYPIFGVTVISLPPNENTITNEMNLLFSFCCIVLYNRSSSIVCKKLFFAIIRINEKFSLVLQLICDMECYEPLHVKVAPLGVSRNNELVLWPLQGPQINVNLYDLLHIFIFHEVYNRWSKLTT